MRADARVLLVALLLPACSARAKPPAGPGGLSLDIPEPWIDVESERRAPPPPAPPPRASENAAAGRIVIEGATVMTATGKVVPDGLVILHHGAIVYAGDTRAVTAEERDGATSIDGKGRFVTPGIIDAHSHIGVYAAPNVAANADGNEITSPVTAQARAEFGYWPQDPAITRALAGGVTAALILPGSANLIGGEGFTVAMRPGRVAREVAFPGAPRTLKMACGENPKRVYGEKGGPQTRMGEYAMFRQTFQQAAEYELARLRYVRTREVWLKKKARAAELDAEAEKAGKKERVKPEPAPVAPPRDAKLETLAAVLRGEVLVQVHCYKAAELREMVAIADEYGFKIRSFHHALEAYKVRDLLVEKGIAINTWADWWGFKMEAFDGIPENAALFFEAGGRPTIHSDSSIGIQRLNQEAAKAMAAGRAAGIKISDDDALRWITANPAWVLGIDDVTGTLEAGKRADVVVWSGSPFSVYSKADVIVEAGQVVYERKRGRPPTDFELGNSAAEVTP
jgi:imidazolonepropionase-like amidohydrolase